MLFYMKRECDFSIQIFLKGTVRQVVCTKQMSANIALPYYFVEFSNVLPLHWDCPDSRQTICACKVLNRLRTSTNDPIPNKMIYI